MKKYEGKFLGPIISILACLFLQVLSLTSLSIPNPPAILLLTIVYASFAGGLRAGAVSGGIGWLYIAYFFSIPDQPFQYTNENLHRVIVWAIAIPLIVWMVGALKKRSMQAVYQQLKEKEESEKRTRDQEARVHAILDSAYDAFAAVDLDGMIVDWNRQARITFGWTRDEVLRRSIADILIPSHFRETFRSNLQNFIQTGIAPILNKRIDLAALHRDGYEIPVELTITPVKTDGTYIFSIFLHDTVEKKENEMIQEIQLAVTRILVGSLSIPEAAEKVLETICRGLKYEYGGYWEFDSENLVLRLACAWHDGSASLQKFENFSRRLTFVKGYGLPGKVVKTAGPVWIHDIPGESKTVFPRSEAAGQAGLHEAFAFPIISDSVVIGVMDFFGKSFQKLDDKHLEVMADIGNRFGLYVKRYMVDQELRTLYRELEMRVRERTQDLLRTEVELRLITNSLPVGIAYIDKNQRYKFCNDTHCKWHGLTREQIVGMQVQEVFKRKEYEKLIPYINKALSGQPVSEEMQLVYSVGLKTIGFSCVPDFDEAGSVRGFVLLVTDISIHKEIESQLKQAKEEAELASEAKSAFLANMSHEIRTPLGVILGFSEVLATEHLSPSDKLSYADAIKRNGNLLSSIINDILDISKVETGKLQVEIQEISVSELLLDITAIVSLHAQEKGLEFSVKMEGEIPAFIRTDPVRLRQILINVVGNSIKFTQRGYVKITVKHLKQEAGSPLAFIVKDSGIGIAPDQAPKLFQPFTQADATATRRFGGTGLGLALSRRLAHLLGGDVELTESEIDQGSTFTVTIDPDLIPNKYDDLGLGH